MLDKTSKPSKTTIHRSSNHAESDGLGFTLNEEGRIVPINPSATRRLSRLLDDVDATVKRHAALTPR